LKLISQFCYHPSQVEDNLDFLIDSSNDIALLNFTYLTLDRALLWFDPDPSWMSDFFYMLNEAQTIVARQDHRNLTRVDHIDVQMAEYVSMEDYTHVYYRFHNICLQLQKGEIFFDLASIAKQANIALMNSINRFYEYKRSSLSEIQYDKKVDEIMKLESGWCIALIKSSKVE
jgi:hypothetical protein